MISLVWTALGVFGCLAMTALGDMVSEEVRDRLDHLPHAVLRLAAHRLNPAQRLTVYQDEWLPELTYVLKGDEARPVTRLISGTWYALGILAKADRIACHLDRPAPEQLPPVGQESVVLVAAVPSVKESHYCTKCGGLRLSDDRFCGRCGARFTVLFSQVDGGSVSAIT